MNLKQFLLFLAITVLLGILNTYVINPVILNVSISFVLIFLSLLLFSIFYRFYKRQFLYAMLNLICLFIQSSILCGFIFIYSLTNEKPDTFADNLFIPENIYVNELNGSVSFDYHADDMAIKEKTEMNFELYKGFQTGLYEYNFWIGKIESGIIYLKAFEITNGIPLSVHNLENRSSISVFNQSDKIVMFGTNNDFTIYEGAWGVPYAARFEVWFRPNNGASEKKLMEKVYKIEGWDR